MARKRSTPSPKPPKPTGLALVDGLAALPRPVLADFVTAASEYILAAVDMEPIAVDGKELTAAARKKAGQIRLSNALGRVLAADLHDAWSEINPVVGETMVSGALRPSKVDVVEMTELDGLKLAVELKPVNLAVGRAIWNRFGDIRVTAVSTHLKYPFAVAGGVLTVPTVEWGKTKAHPGGTWKSTEHLIARLIELLRRAGGRQREDDAPHRLEGVAVVVFDPLSGALRSDLPKAGSGLRWQEAVEALATAYQERFLPREAAVLAADDDSDDLEAEEADATDVG